MAHEFIISLTTLPSGKTAYYATLAGSNKPKFIIGTRAHYKDNVGLVNVNTKAMPVYDPATYAAGKHGFWAYFIAPTAKAESNGSFVCLNTYDRAKFTFGFMQYAAHVPKGDFVKFLKKLLERPNAKDYFPRLLLDRDNIIYDNNNGIHKQLEDEDSTQALMNYLNPTLNDVENQELICAARLIHWAMNDPEHVKIQVDTAIEHFKDNMKSYHRRFNLQGVPDYVCQVICDIRHQGRSNNDQIALALQTGGDYKKAYANLLSLGSEVYPTRVATIKKVIDAFIKNGTFGKKYDSAGNSFR